MDSNTPEPFRPRVGGGSQAHPGDLNLTPSDSIPPSQHMDNIGPDASPPALSPRAAAFARLFNGNPHTMTDTRPADELATPNPIPEQYREHIPDLSNIPGTDLRKVPEKTVRDLELNGQIYAGIFRALQVREDKYDRFYNGVLRNVRNKHHDDVKRSTAASVRHLTDIALRGFGYIIWTQDSEWSLPDDELAQGEVRLKYVRGGGIQDENNARFYPIFEQLWALTRNVMFEPRPPVRPRQTTRAQPSRTPKRIRRDGSSNSTNPEPHFLSLISDSLMKTRAPPVETNPYPFDDTFEQPPTDPIMTKEETKQAILDLLPRLSAIRSSSNPEVFDALWEEQVGRMAEYDAAAAQRAGYIARARNFGIPPSSTQSNEPWMSKGNPVMTGNTPLTPIRPGQMSVYISVMHLPSPTLLSNNIDHILNTTAAASEASHHAYHWTDAPVLNYQMHDFLVGINQRITDMPSKILGYTFAYGWNDTVRFITTGRMEDGDLAKEDEYAVRNSIGEDPVDFHLSQYKFLGMGWQQFQEDLLHAAECGVRVFRMKIGVLALAPTRTRA